MRRGHYLRAMGDINCVRGRKTSAPCGGAETVKLAAHEKIALEDQSGDTFYRARGRVQPLRSRAVQSGARRERCLGLTAPADVVNEMNGPGKGDLCPFDR